MISVAHGEAIVTEAIPESISRDGESAIIITFSDGHQSRWTASALRKACPCATCREKQKSVGQTAGGLGASIGALPVLSAAEARPLAIEAMQPVGNYAYNIAFSDGHSSGIFPFSRLYEDPATAATTKPTD